MVARATIGHSPDITVLDRCETPLELCRRFSRHWSLPIATRHIDLQSLTAPADFDVVFAHSILQFIAADRRLDVLSRLCRSLRPDGRLIMMFRTGNRVEDDFLSEYRTGYAERLIAQLDSRNIVLPEPRETFRRRVENYAEERRAREGALRDRAEVEKLIAQAGFAIESLTPTEAKLAMPFQDITAKLSKRHFLVIARPR
jgi:SAM-dependent methyltransferase